MQKILSVPKIIIFAVLSCSLISLTWNPVTHMEVERPSLLLTATLDTDERSSLKPSESIWHSLREEFSLDHRAQSSQVKAEIKKLLADKEKLQSILLAAGPYIHYIHQQTKSRGLPAELALVPVIESEFNPNDRSHKGATGLWQLMPATAKLLGVKVFSGYDGRRNVVASTQAALVYFKDLGKYFNGNWYLALAAYNCGQSLIKSAMKRSGSASFWNLTVPKETKYYVPKLLAVAAIVKNPAKYGVELPAVKNEPFFTELKVNKAVNLEKIAKSAGINIKTLHTLNPDHKSGIVPMNGTNILLVPITMANLIKV